MGTKYVIVFSRKEEREEPENEIAGRTGRKSMSLPSECQTGTKSRESSTGHSLDFEILPVSYFLASGHLSILPSFLCSLLLCLSF